MVSVAEALMRFAAGQPVRVDQFERLCDEFAALASGTTARFERGVDFTSRPSSFRQMLLVTFKNRGIRIRTAVRGDYVYAEQLEAPAPHTSGGDPFATVSLGNARTFPTSVGVHS